LLWVNLIIDIFIASALTTDLPGPMVLERPPDRKSALLITVCIYKMILEQAIYQLSITLVLYFTGALLLGYKTNKDLLKSLNTLIFNTFVWVQIFNKLNNRRLNNSLNIFKGITKN
ncbi:cation-transporting P-type ATPase, partial [Lasiosphaeria hispida]